MKTYTLYAIKRGDEFVDGELTTELPSAAPFWMSRERLLSKGGLDEERGDRVVTLHVVECEEGETPPDVEELQRKLVEADNVGRIMRASIDWVTQERDTALRELAEARECIRKIHNESTCKRSMGTSYGAMLAIADAYVQKHAEWYGGDGKKGDCSECDGDGWYTIPGNIRMRCWGCNTKGER